MQHLGRLIAFQHLALGSFISRRVVDHAAKRSSFLFTRLIKSSKHASFLFTRPIKSSKHAMSGSHGGSVAMEVVVAWNDAEQKRLSDEVFQESGMRCLISSASLLCNVNDTVDDALQQMRTRDCNLRSMWEELKIFSTSIITANVYYHYGRFIHENGAHIIVVDVVYPKHEVVTLRLETKLWRAKEMMNKRRSLLEREARKTRNVFGEYTEFVWREGSYSNNSNHKTLNRLQVTPENRLWLEIRTL